LTGKLYRTLPVTIDSLRIPGRTLQIMRNARLDHYHCINKRYAATITQIGKNKEAKNYLLIYNHRNNRIHRAVPLDRLATILGVDDEDRVKTGEVSAIGDNGEWAIQTVEVDHRIHKIRWDFNGLDKQFVKQMVGTLTNLDSKNGQEIKTLVSRIEALEKTYKEARCELRRIRPVVYPKN
jgi:hypothetical protein